LAKAKTTAKAKKALSAKKKAELAVGGGSQKPSPDDVIDYINMRHGRHGPVIRKANETWDAYDLRRPCGVPGVDINSGGGLPAGNLSQLDGPESVGKNYLLNLYIREGQGNYGRDSVTGMCCFEPPDKRFMQLCGVWVPMSDYDIDVTQSARKRLGQELMSRSEIKAAKNMLEIGDVHFLDTGPAEDRLNGIVHMVDANIYQIIGIDSWDSLLTQYEKECDLGEDARVAAAASVETMWMKKVTDALSPKYRCPDCGFAPLESNVTSFVARRYNYVCSGCNWKGKDPFVEINTTTIIAIRQARAKNVGRALAKQRGRDYHSQGAWALKHGNQVRISLHPGEIFRVGKTTIGKEINWQIAKGKSGAREYSIGSFGLNFDPIFTDVVHDLVSYCLQHQIVEQAGKGYYNIPVLDISKIHGRAAINDLVNENENYFEILLDEVYNAEGLAHVRFA